MGGNLLLVSWPGTTWYFNSSQLVPIENFLNAVHGFWLLLVLSLCYAECHCYEYIEEVQVLWCSISKVSFWSFSWDSYLFPVFCHSVTLRDFPCGQAWHLGEFPNLCPVKPRQMQGPFRALCPAKGVLWVSVYMSANVLVSGFVAVKVRWRSSFSI